MIGLRQLLFFFPKKELLFISSFNHIFFFFFNKWVMIWLKKIEICILGLTNVGVWDLTFDLKKKSTCRLSLGHLMLVVN